MSTPTQPSAAAMRAATRIREGLMRDLLYPDPTDQRVIADAIDTELAAERERARELEAALVKVTVGLSAESEALHREHGSIGNLIDTVNEIATSALAKLRADREGGK
jgi:hypothetical protein